MGDENGHRANRPARRIRRRRAQRTLDHSDDLIVVDHPRPAGASLIPQPLGTIVEEALTPLAGRVLMHAQLGRNPMKLETTFPENTK